MKELKVKVGDKVIVSSGWIEDRLATVTKITPTGRIRIDVFNDIQFDKYGREMGCDDRLGNRKRIAICTPENKRFEHDYIRRWRVVAMLNNIKTHLNDPNLPKIVDNYIKFSKEIDEYKWELENR